MAVGVRDEFDVVVLCLVHYGLHVGGVVDVHDGWWVFVEV